MTSNVLYRSQSAAADVFNTHLLPCYSAEYIQSQKGLSGMILWSYSKAYDGAEWISHVLTSMTSAVATVGDFALGWAIRPVLDVVYPINPINGNRHFTGVPRKIEQVLGDWVFYPMASGNMRSTHECLPNSNKRIADEVNKVVGRITEGNAELLNPKGETAFNYRVKTVGSTQINAFAVPAGGMVVFSQIVKEIDAAIRSGAIKESTVEFADGSKATVDLSKVTLEDTLAALLGHEMTHVASRHSMVAIFGSLIRTIVLNVGRFVFIGYLKTCDKEYTALVSKPESERTQGEIATLASKEHLYSQLNDVFAWIEEKFKNLAGLFHSRKNEYEADVTGTYFAKQAGYNPLGAIYLQEILSQGKGGISDAMHKYLEFFYTHPYGENRKRAIFGAIQEIDPNALKGKTDWEVAEGADRYDPKRLSPAMQLVRKHSQSE